MSGIVSKNAGRASGIVGAGDIGADAVSGANIADDAIDSEHYADGSIDNAHIADDAIDSEHYAAGSIDEAHIADNAVTLAKMAGGTDGNIISFDASGDPVAIATGDDGQVLTSTGAGSPPAFETAAGGTTSATDCESGSRDISIANSTQSFTAFGQQPDLVDIMFVVSGSVRGACWAKVNANGTDFGLSMNSSHANSVAQQWTQTGTTFVIQTSSGNYTQAQPTITSTGIDLAFAKTGSPTGTCNILITYMKFA